MFKQSVRVDERSKKDFKDYCARLDAMSSYDLLREFFTYIDYTEESENGREFHPVTIGCCRALMSVPLDELLKRMRRY